MRSINSTSSRKLPNSCCSDISSSLVSFAFLGITTNSLVQDTRTMSGHLKYLLTFEIKVQTFL